VAFCGVSTNGCAFHATAYSDSDAIAHTSAHSFSHTLANATTAHITAYFSSHALANAATGHALAYATDTIVAWMLLQANLGFFEVPWQWSFSGLGARCLG